MKCVAFLVGSCLLARAALAQQSGHTSEREPNESAATATVSALGDTLLGSIATVGDVDYFAFDVPAGTMLRMARTANEVNACLIDRNGVSILGCFRTVVWTGSFNYPLTVAGRYYMRFWHSQPSAGDIRTGPYGVAVQAESITLGSGDPTTVFAATVPRYAKRSIVAGYEGELYLLSATYSDSGFIDRVDPLGSVSPLAAVPNATGGFAMDVFGNLLVSRGPVNGHHGISRIAPDGKVTQFAAHAGLFYTYDGFRIAVGPDGDVWAGEADTILRFGPTGAIKARISVPYCNFSSLAVSPAGVLHFTSFAGGCRGVSALTPTGWQLVIRDTVGDLAFDRDGKLYVGQWDGQDAAYTDYPNLEWGHVTVFDPTYRRIEQVAHIPGLGIFRFLRDPNGRMTSRIVAAYDRGGDVIRELSGAESRVPGLGPPRAQTVTVSLREASLGAFYVDSLRVAMGAEPLSWSVVSGTPPPGITVTSDGEVSGTPSDTGAFALDLQAAGATTFWRGRAILRVATVAISHGSIVDALVGWSPLNPALADFLDRHGNRNSRLDVGDFRAYVRTQQP